MDVVYAACEEAVPHPAPQEEPLFLGRVAPHDLELAQLELALYRDFFGMQNNLRFFALYLLQFVFQLDEPLQFFLVG
jgi:hypothetical protein